MPRKSINELGVAAPVSSIAPQLLRPGSHVPDSAKTVFQEIVASVRDGHFQPIDRPLLEQYAVAISIAREVAQASDKDGTVVDGKVNPACKFLKQQQALCGQLASRLRLTTQNRMSKEKATTGAYGGAESIAELYERAK